VQCFYIYFIMRCVPRILWSLRSALESVYLYTEYTCVCIWTSHTFFWLTPLQKAAMPGKII